MYQEFFGLTEKPFDLLPNPKFLYPSKAHQRVRTYLQHGIRDRAGFILLTGEVGSGKTTIIREIIKSQLSHVTLAKVFNTKVDSHQLLCMINDDFGLETQGRDKAALLRELNDFLIKEYAEGRQVVLIIDEAQNLSLDLLEEVRMLSNLETDSGKLLRIILVGQPELRSILAAPSMLQLRQRIQINCHIDPLSQEEVEAYVLHRLERAGNREALEFGEGAMEAIHSYSRGIPRLVNILCDYVMLDAYAMESREVTAESVHDLARDLSFEAQYWQADAGAGEQGEARGGNPGAGGADEEELSLRFSERTNARAKLQSYLHSLNKRITQVEEEAGRFNQSAFLELVERMDALERAFTRHREETEAKQALMRVHGLGGNGDVRQTPAQEQFTLQEEQPPPPGTMRAIWKFLWGE